MSLLMTAYAPMTDTSGRHKDHSFATPWASCATGDDLRTVFTEPLLYSLPQSIATDELFPFQGAQTAPIDYRELKDSREDLSLFYHMYHDRVYEQLYVVSTRVHKISSRLQLRMLCHDPRSCAFERASPGHHPRCGGQRAVFISAMLRRAHIQSARSGT
jgi:hypothetical protein